ncbi:DUF502 domain-containing protein [Loktanella sp. SALINAS62]|uniref:DUF502 domain-containing protein n=1 Tax=Loktanella sp. SALINAS62 TaxID=2706124 RepID=UPI001B8B7438|nr:DUF502 domain-containing protein [Loktanella sp. SALINAS62]MBS1302881.1 DUF502 domain-containing protein [Loktanella sp. SALINAS62]
MPPENDPLIQPARRPGVLARTRSNFIAGLVIIAPIALTLWLIYSVVGLIDGWVWPFVPDQYHPNALLNRWFNADGGPPITMDVRGVGVVIFLLFTIIIGWLGKGFLGRSALRFAERFVDRMPVVRSVYNGAKQIAETVFSQRDSSFDRACLIEYPRKGLWAVAFISTAAKGEVLEKLPGEEILTVFLPTTPNPTSGFLLFLPRKDVIFLDMNVEAAAKLVISAGLVYPQDAPKTPDITD